MLGVVKLQELSTALHRKMCGPTCWNARLMRGHSLVTRRRVFPRLNNGKESSRSEMNQTSDMLDAAAVPTTKEQGMTNLAETERCSCFPNSTHQAEPLADDLWARAKDGGGCLLLRYSIFLAKTVRRLTGWADESEIAL